MNGLERADIEDENGKVNLTVKASVVSIKQSGDLIRMTHKGARELALDIAECLDATDKAARNQVSLPIINGIGRDARDATGRTVFLSLDRPPTVDELRALHDYVRSWSQ